MLGIKRKPVRADRTPAVSAYGQEKIGIGGLLLGVTYLTNSGYALTTIEDAPALILLFFTTAYLVIRNIPTSGKPARTPLRQYSALILVIFAIPISLLVHSDFGSWGGYLRQAFVLLCAILLTRIISFRAFGHYVKCVMNVLTCVSIAVWLSYNVFSISLPLPLIEGPNITYYNGLLFFVFQNDPSKLIGPFWEAGLFASMAILTILIALYLDPDKGKPITIPLMVIGILLTTSTAGYLLAAAVCCMRFFGKARSKSATIAFVICAFLFAIIWVNQESILMWLATQMPDVFGKILRENLSFTTRFNGPMVDLSIYMQDPVFGVGMTSYLDQWPLVAEAYQVESRTSTITYFFAVYGILSIAFLAVLVKGSIGNRNSSLIEGWCLLFIVISVLSKEPHYFNLTMITFVCYLLTEGIRGSEIDAESRQTLRISRNDRI